ncbi:MAG: hydrogenase subunit MbhD domain-containing protein [Lawsonella clevelandensis]
MTALGHPLSQIAVSAINTHTASYRAAVIHNGPQLHATHLHLIAVNEVLLLSLLAIVIGLLLAWQRKRVDALLDRELLPRDGATNLATVWESMRSAGNLAGTVTRSDSPTRHVGAFVIVLGALAGTVAVGSFSGQLDFPDRVPASTAPSTSWCSLSCWWRPSPPSPLTPGWPQWCSSVQLESPSPCRFSPSAPRDVGLTQLLVEIITTVMYMLVLRRLPHLPESLAAAASLRRHHRRLFGTRRFRCRLGIHGAPRSARPQPVLS